MDKTISLTHWGVGDSGSSMSSNCRVVLIPDHPVCLLKCPHTNLSIYSSRVLYCDKLYSGIDLYMVAFHIYF